MLARARVKGGQMVTGGTSKCGVCSLFKPAGEVITVALWRSGDGTDKPFRPVRVCTSCTTRPVADVIGAPTPRRQDERDVPVPEYVPYGEEEAKVSKLDALALIEASSRNDFRGFDIILEHADPRALIGSPALIAERMAIQGAIVGGALSENPSRRDAQQVRDEVFRKVREVYGQWG